MLFFSLRFSSAEGKHMYYMFLTIAPLSVSMSPTRVSLNGKSDAICYGLLANEVWTEYSWPMLIVYKVYNIILRICATKRQPKETSIKVSSRNISDKRKLNPDNVASWKILVQIFSSPQWLHHNKGLISFFHLPTATSSRGGNLKLVMSLMEFLVVLLPSQVRWH